MFLCAATGVWNVLHLFRDKILVRLGYGNFDSPDRLIFLFHFHHTDQESIDRYVGPYGVLIRVINPHLVVVNHSDNGGPLSTNSSEIHLHLLHGNFRCWSYTSTSSGCGETGLVGERGVS